jgi:hypothetical protein
VPRERIGLSPVLVAVQPAVGRRALQETVGYAVVYFPTPLGRPCKTPVSGEVGILSRRAHFVQAMWTPLASWRRRARLSNLGVAFKGRGPEPGGAHEGSPQLQLKGHLASCPCATGAPSPDTVLGIRGSSVASLEAGSAWEARQSARVIPGLGWSARFSRSRAGSPATAAGTRWPGPRTAPLGLFRAIARSPGLP